MGVHVRTVKQLALVLVIAAASTLVPAAAMAQTVSSITVTSTLANVYRGQTATLTCTATLSTGGTEACPSPVYTESSGGSVITLSGASFTGYAFGTTTVTATSSAKTATLVVNDIPPPQELLGNIAAPQATTGLGFNVTQTNAWEFALAKAAGATSVRFQCGWSGVENQAAPPNNVQGSPAYSLTSTGCAQGLANAAANGLNVDIIAAYGPPFHKILTVTVPAGAAIGATTLQVTFSSGVGGDTMASATPLIDNIMASSGAQLSPLNSYAGTLITAVTHNTTTTATLTLASGLTAALPANTTTTYIINEGLYAPPATWATTNASIIAYANYVQYLAQQISAVGLTGQVEIWNEPAWPGDAWDNILDFYDTEPAARTPGPQYQWLPNYGFAALLQTRTPPAGVTYNWGGTEKSGDSTLVGSGSGMFANTGVSLVQPSTALTSESLHPYGNNPEDNLWSAPWLAPTTGNNDYYVANLFGVGPNMSLAAQASMLARETNPAYGLSDNITETGFSTNSSDATHQARFALRQLIGFWAAGITNVDFYRLYDTSGGGAGFTNPSTEAPLQSYTAVAGLESDAALIRHAPPQTYSAATLSTVTSWGNLTGYPLDSMHIVGATSATATANSELMVLYQRSYVNPSLGTQWSSLAQPTAEPVTVTMPAGQQLISATNLTTRAAVSTSVAGQVVTLSVSDDPVELLVEPIPATPNITLTGGFKLLGASSLTAQPYVAPPVGNVTYAADDFCDAADYSGATDTSTTCTTGTVTAGDALVIVSVSGEFTTFTDSAGGTISQFTGFPFTWNSGTNAWQAYCLPNAAAGAHTITLAGSPATQYVAMIVMGFHGAAATNPCTPTTTAATATGTGTTASAGAVTTTVANSALVAVAQDLAVNINAATGYTGVASPNAGFGAEYMLAPTTGSYTPTFSLSGSDTWVQTSLIVHP